LYRLDQDGPEPDDDEPDPKRGITTGKQKPDGTSEITGTLDAETRAYWDAIHDPPRYVGRFSYLSASSV
jgi:hypothetical protein